MDRFCTTAKIIKKKHNVKMISNNAIIIYNYYKICISQNCQQNRTIVLILYYNLKTIFIKNTLIQFTWKHHTSHAGLMKRWSGPRGEGWVDFCSIIQKQPHTLKVSDGAGFTQRSAAIHIPCINLQHNPKESTLKEHSTFWLILQLPKS